MMARRLLPSLCPLLWDVEATVRETAFDVVQSILNRIFAGHQEWVKSGVEPKKPVDPPKAAPQGVIGVTSSYMSSAVSWVAGSLLGKGGESKPAATTTTGTADSTKEPPKAVSSSTVNNVLPSMPTMEISMDALESIGKPSSSSSASTSATTTTTTTMNAGKGMGSLSHAESMTSMGDEDMWGDSTSVPAPATADWGSGWADEDNDDDDGDDSGFGGNGKAGGKAVKDAVASIGGWGDTVMTFSDEETEEAKKEDANLEMIRRMAKKEEEPSSGKSVGKPAMTLKGI